MKRRAWSPPTVQRVSPSEWEQLSRWGEAFARSRELIVSNAGAFRSVRAEARRPSWRRVFCRVLPHAWEQRGVYRTLVVEVCTRCHRVRHRRNLERLW